MFNTSYFASKNRFRANANKLQVRNTKILHRGGFKF